MKKRNTISYETTRLLFDDSDRTDYCSFRIFVDGEPHELKIPPEVMYRLYRVGQAYGIRNLRYFESNARFIVGSTEVASLINDLSRALELVNDEVLHHYSEQVLIALRAPAQESRMHVAITTSDYFSRKH